MLPKELEISPLSGLEGVNSDFCLMAKNVREHHQYVKVMLET